MAGQQRAGQTAPTRWGAVFPARSQPVQSGAADSSGLSAAALEADKTSSLQAITTSRHAEAKRRGANDHQRYPAGKCHVHSDASAAGLPGQPAAFRTGFAPPGFLPAQQAHARRGKTSIASPLKAFRIAIGMQDDQAACRATRLIRVAHEAGRYPSKVWPKVNFDARSRTLLQAD